MDQDLLERASAASVSRRTVVKTGAKLAYAAPLVAATMKLGANGALAVPAVCDPRHKTLICHRTCSETNPYVLICVDNHSLDKHGVHICKAKDKTTYEAVDIIPAPIVDGVPCCPNEDGGCGGTVQSFP